MPLLGCSGEPTRAFAQHVSLPANPTRSYRIFPVERAPNVSPLVGCRNGRKVCALTSHTLPVPRTRAQSLLHAPPGRARGAHNLREWAAHHLRSILAKLVFIGCDGRLDAELHSPSRPLGNRPSWTLRAAPRLPRPGSLSARPRSQTSREARRAPPPRLHKVPSRAGPLWDAAA